MGETVKLNLDGIRDLLEREHMEGILLSDPNSVLFFSGFKSSYSLFLVTKTGGILFTSPLYLEAAKQAFMETDIEVRPMPGLEEWKHVYRKLKIEMLGVETDHVVVSTYNDWKWNFDVFLKPASDELAMLRSHKTDRQVAAAEKACSIADSAMQNVLPELRPGISEKKFAWQLEKAGRELGAEKVSFEAIVAFGENSAKPHHHPSDRQLQKNEAVLIDWGFVAEDFCSDCTRCFFVGTPTAEWRKVYAQVLAGQQAGIAAMRPGAKIAETKPAEEAALGQPVPHCGHGVGVEVHEFPRVHPKTVGEYTKNMLVTCEPGVYLPGRFGIRIEDLVVITGEGNRLLTKLPKTPESAIIPTDR